MAFRKKKIFGTNTRPHRLFKPWTVLSVGGKIWRLTWVTVCLLWVGTFLQVLLYKFQEPVLTPHMLSCHIEQRQDLGFPVHYSRICVPIEKISPNLVKAVISAEDKTFLYHRGFSFNGLKNAYLKNKAARHIVRGGSSISQQTAKNCFLPFDRNMIRKIVEAHYTFLIEMLWGKERIMECYLNVIEFGPGIYGCEAASQHYFHHSAASLSVDEAAMLAATLNRPLTANPKSHTPYYDYYTALVKSKIQVNKPINWENEYNGMDPDFLKEKNKGLLLFIKWWCIQKLKNTDKEIKV